MPEPLNKYKSKTITEVANTYGYSYHTFCELLSPVHYHDIIHLGFRLTKHKLPVLCVKYLHEVVIHQLPRLEVFPHLPVRYIIIE